MPLPAMARHRIVLPGFDGCLVLILILFVSGINRTITSAWTSPIPAPFTAAMEAALAGLPWLRCSLREQKC